MNLMLPVTSDEPFAAAITQGPTAGSLSWRCTVQCWHVDHTVTKASLLLFCHTQSYFIVQDSCQTPVSISPFQGAE